MPLAKDSQPPGCSTLCLPGIPAPYIPQLCQYSVQPDWHITALGCHCGLRKSLLSSQHSTAYLRSVLSLFIYHWRLFFFSGRIALSMKAILNLEVWLWKNSYSKMCSGTVSLFLTYNSVRLWCPHSKLQAFSKKLAWLFSLMLFCTSSFFDLHKISKYVTSAKLRFVEAI